MDIQRGFAVSRGAAAGDAVFAGLTPELTARAERVDRSTNSYAGTYGEDDAMDNNPVRMEAQIRVAANQHRHG